MFESLAGSLRGGVPDRLAQMLDSDPRDTRRAMEVSLPALIGGLRDKTLEPGGSEDLAALLSSDDVVMPDALDAFMASGDARTGAGILDRVFGERGEGALTSLSKASGLSTRLLARVMSMLAPVATGWLSAKRGEDDMDEAQLAVYLEGEVAGLEEKGYGKVLALLGGAGAATASAGVAAITGSQDAVKAAKPTAKDAKTDDEADTDAMTDGAKTGAKDANDAGSTVKIGGGKAAAGAAGVAAAGAAAAGAKIKKATPPSTDATISLGGDAGERLVEVNPTDLPDIDQRDELGAVTGSAEKSGKGAGLWWAIAGLALVALLVLTLARCTGGDDTTATGPALTATNIPNDSIPAGDIEQNLQPAVDQGTINNALSIYNGVSGTIENNVITLRGTVTEEGIRVGAIEAANSVANGALVESEIQVVEPYTIARIVETNPGNFSSLQLLLNEAGLTGALKGAGPFTVFAPVDFAFSAMTDLEELRADPARLSELLQYHVVQGEYTVEQLKAIDVLPTLFNGEPIKVSTDADGNVLLNELVSIAQPDNQADNGMLHTITSVLRPVSEGGITAPSELGEALALEPITFDSGSSTIATESEAELDRVVDYLLENPQPIEIAGHTDSDGPAGADYNQTLSQERADAVRQYLINNGIPQDLITATGFGDTQPVAANDTEANRQLNRRIEFNLGG